MSSEFKNRGFETTQWSVVLKAKSDREHLARQAIETLCGQYWFPLFAFVRRRGHDETESEDLVQAFFVHLIEKDVFAAAEKDRGRFRTFLLSSLENFLNNQHAKSTTLRRGGGKSIASLDLKVESGAIPLEISRGSRPEDEFNRQWAIAVLNRVLSAIELEYEKRGDAEMFRVLRPYLSTDSDRKPYAVIAESLAMSESNVKVAVHRLRKRYRKQLEEEISTTVQSPDQIQDEIGHLFAALGG